MQAQQLEQDSEYTTELAKVPTQLSTSAVVALAIQDSLESIGIQDRIQTPCISFRYCNKDNTGRNRVGACLQGSTLEVRGCLGRSTPSSLFRLQSRSCGHNSSVCKLDSRVLCCLGRLGIGPLSRLRLYLLRSFVIVNLLKEDVGGQSGCWTWECRGFERYSMFV